MKRAMNYRKKSMEELFKNYVDENNRINRLDEQITKKHIVTEVYARVKTAFELLEEAETEEEADKIYKQFLKF